MIGPGPGRRRCGSTSRSTTSRRLPTELDPLGQLTVAEADAAAGYRRHDRDVAPVTVPTRKPVVIAPPLDGPNWLDGDSCCDMTAHRMALNPHQRQTVGR